MNIRKLAALALALLLCASSAVPMASAAKYEGEAIHIGLTVDATEQSDGSYDLTYGASLTMGLSASKAFATLLAGQPKAEMDKLTFVCVLNDSVLGSRTLTAETLTAFTMTDSRSANELLSSARQGEDGIRLIYRLNEATTSAWDRAPVETIQNALYNQTITFRSNRPLNVTAAALSGTITTTAYVDIYKDGQLMNSADHAAYGEKTWSKPSSSGGGSSGGGGGSSGGGGGGGGSVIPNVPVTPVTPVTPVVPEVPVITPQPEIVQEKLVTETSIAYTVGDDQRNWRPNDSVKRSEVTTMFYRLLREKNPAAARIFSDTDDSAWYTEAVKAVSNAGVITGYPDGTFRPENAITRAEFIAMCVRFASEGAVSAGNWEFPDVPADHWAHDLILRARGFGWIIGDAYGRFNPDATLTRTEAVTIINRMLGRTWDAASGVADFPDVPKGFWGYEAIMASAT